MQNSFTKSVFVILLFLVFTISPATAFSFGSGPPDIKEIRKTIDKEDYAKAITQLQDFLKENKNKENADAWNMLGYSQRKSDNSAKRQSLTKKR